MCLPFCCCDCCLPFCCCDRDDQGPRAPQGTRPSPSPAADRGDGYPHVPSATLKGANNGYDVGKNNGAEQQERHGSGADQGTRPSPPADHGDGHPHVPSATLKGANNGYDVGKNNGADQHERAAAGVNVNSEPAGGAAFVPSDTDKPPAASVGVVRGPKGDAEKIATPAAPVAHEHWVPTKTGVPTPTSSGAPAAQARVAAGARHHGGPVATSQPPKEGATGTIMKTAPVPLVARRDEDGDGSATAASSYSRWKQL